MCVHVCFVQLKCPLHLALLGTVPWLLELLPLLSLLLFLLPPYPFPSLSLSVPLLPPSTSLPAVCKLLSSQVVDRHVDVIVS